MRRFNRLTWEEIFHHLRGKENFWQKYQEQTLLKFGRVFADYFLDSSNEVFLNSFKSFSNAKVDFLALVPAALFPFSACVSASVLNVSNSALIFSINSFISKFIYLSDKNKDKFGKSVIFPAIVVLFFDIFLHAVHHLVQKVDF